MPKTITGSVGRGGRNSPSSDVGTVQYSQASASRCEGWRLRPHLYLFRCSARRLIDGAIDGSGAERINHGCEPNLVARFDHRRVFLLSLCPIAKGEELLFDYHVRGDIAPIPCRCGAPSCRGFLNAPDPS